MLFEQNHMETAPNYQFLSNLLKAMPIQLEMIAPKRIDKPPPQDLRLKHETQDSPPLLSLGALCVS